MNVSLCYRPGKFLAGTGPDTGKAQCLVISLQSSSTSRGVFDHDFIAENNSSTNKPGFSDIQLLTQKIVQQRNFDNAESHGRAPMGENVNPRLKNEW